MRNRSRDFPRREADIIKHAEKLIDGLIKYPDIFKDPPISTDELQKGLEKIIKAMDDAADAHAVAKELTKKKDAEFTDYGQNMKTVYRHYENVYNFDDATMEKLGWHGRHPKTKTKLPPACYDLTVTDKTETGYAAFKFRLGKEGGPVDFCRLESRKKGESHWTLLDTTYKKEVSVKHREKGVTYEFRVKASNKSGLGNPSNTVAITF